MSCLMLNKFLTVCILKETVVNVLTQIERMQYETELMAKGFAPGQIRRYGFAFKGKECLIG